MTVPLLTSRDTLAEVLCDVREDDEHAPFAAPPCRYCLDLADALLASGVVRAVDGLADDEALVERVAKADYAMHAGPGAGTFDDDWLTDAEQHLRALAAALATPTE